MHDNFKRPSDDIGGAKPRESADVRSLEPKRPEREAERRYM